MGRVERGARRVAFILFELNATYALIVSIAFWSLLYPWMVVNHSVFCLHNFVCWHQHVLNALLMIVELSIVRRRFRRADAYWVVAWISAYVCFMWRLAWKRDEWPYPMFDLGRLPDLAPLFYIGLGCASLGMFFCLDTLCLRFLCADDTCCDGGVGTGRLGRGVRGIGMRVASGMGALGSSCSPSRQQSRWRAAEGVLSMRRRREDRQRKATMIV
jgi:hypothetical protein